MPQPPPYSSVDMRVEDEPPPEDVAALNDRLYRHNAAITGCDNYQEIPRMLAKLESRCDFGCAEADELRRWIEAARSRAS